MNLQVGTPRPQGVAAFKLSTQMPSLDTLARYKNPRMCAIRSQYVFFLRRAAKVGDSGPLAKMKQEDQSIPTFRPQWSPHSLCH